MSQKTESTERLKREGGAVAHKLQEIVMVRLSDVVINGYGRLLVGNATLHTAQRPLFPEDVPEGHVIVFIAGTGEVIALTREGEVNYDKEDRLKLPPSKRPELAAPMGMPSRIATPAESPFLYKTWGKTK